MLKITVFESNWFNSQEKEFDNVFDALQYARVLRAENVEDRKVEIYCDPWQMYCTAENISRTDKVAAGTYVDYNSLPEPKEAEDDDHEGLIEEAREWVDQWAREVGFDDVETEDTALYERKLEEQYVYLCRLRGIEPLACYISE